jgi:hypothetical protein
VRLGASPGVRSVEVQTPPASPTSGHQGPRLTPGGLLASFDKSILQVRFVFVWMLQLWICDYQTLSLHERLQNTELAGFPQSLQANSNIVSRLCDDHFLSNLFLQFFLFLQSLPGGKFSILGDHSIGHSKQNVCIYMCPIPNVPRDRAVSLHSSKIVDKKEISRTVSVTGIYCSSYKVGTVYLVGALVVKPLCCKPEGRGFKSR